MGDEPYYTRIPNSLIERLPELGDALLRVAIVVCRQTIGWGRQWQQISIPEFKKLTGLSEQGIRNALKSEEAKGVIERRPVGQSFSYRLLVNELEGASRLRGQSSRGEEVNEFGGEGKPSGGDEVKFVDLQSGTTTLEGNGLQPPKERLKITSKESLNKVGAKNVRPLSTSAPEVFLISAGLRAWANKNFPDLQLDLQTELFLDYHRSKGTVFKNWSAAWRNWIRRSAQFQEERNEKGVRDNKFESASQRQDRILGERNYDSLVAQTIAVRRAGRSSTT